MLQSKLAVVRVVELVRVGLGCFGFVLLLIGTIAHGPEIVNSISFYNAGFHSNTTRENSENLDDGTRNSTKLVLIVLWVFLAIVSICLVFEIFITRTLLAACKSDCDNTRALTGARRWRNVRIIFLLFYPCSFYYYQQAGLLALLIGLFMYHLMGILVVHMFINELEQNSPPDNLIVDCQDCVATQV